MRSCRDRVRPTRISAGIILCLAVSWLIGIPPSVSAQDGTPKDSAARLWIAARESFAAADTAKAREHLQAYLSLTRPKNDDGGYPTEAYGWSQRLAKVAQEYLCASLLEDACDVLGEAADLKLPTDEQLDDGLASAAAAWHRRLATLDAEERFELLYAWSMPTESRRTVRVLTSLVPHDAPPSVFARALGERPRRDSFGVSDIGDISGLFSTAWELVIAAGDAGTLRKLTAELSQLNDSDVPNAHFVLTLARIVGAHRADDQLLDELAARTDTRPMIDLVVAAACLTQERLQPIGERIVKAKLEQTFDSEPNLMRPFLRQMLATAISRRYAERGLDVGQGIDLELWVSSAEPQSGVQVRGAARSLWLTHEDHTLHLTGPGSDYLFFKYPLTGEFEFWCNAQFGRRAGTACGVSFGGLTYELRRERRTLRVWDAYHGLVGESPCPFVSNNPQETFNKFTLKSSNDGVTFSCNLHAIRTDTAADLTSPWIALRSDGYSAPVFRDLKLTGNPVIPREVKMSSGDSLRGWVASYYDWQLPTDGSGREDDVGPAWFLKEGIIHGPTTSLGKRETENAITRQSRLYYLRPLLNGESIRYEFQYEPGRLVVHPALGRIAFLIEPGGVRIHWMTDGDQEWTGLPDDNAVVEPLNRRGPRPLPLKPGEWNRVMLTLASDTLTMSLNDTTVYSRQIEPENQRTFGFYHDMSRSEARVRNVVMRGDWPETLSSRQINNLGALANAKPAAAGRRVRGAIFDDRHIAGATLRVHRHAASLPAKHRYDYLSDWVLPGVDHDTLRLASDFTPTNPAPPIDFTLPLGGRASITHGGDLVSPAWDLVSTAKELGRLRELQAKVAAIPVADEPQLRSQLAMLALVEIGLGDLAKARTTLDKFVLTVASRETFSFAERWPEALVIWKASEYSETRDVIRDLVFDILNKQRRHDSSSGSEAWDQHLPALMGRITYLDLLEREPGLRETAPSGASSPSPLANWVSASRETSRTRGQGFPHPRWAIPEAATVQNVASHHDDYLFYRIPLRGNFEVECDVTGFGYRESSLWVAGRWARLFHTLGDVKTGDFREEQSLPLDPPMHKADSWIRYRTVVRDGVCTTYANGREIQRRALDAEHDPWIAIRSWNKTNGAVRNLRITGSPQIPAEVRLTANADLPGWSPINEGHQVEPGGKWQQLGELANGGGLYGTRSGELAGSHWETLLRYHRPMVEDGTIEYDFYYQPGEVHVHPALDRLAFMLQPAGVRVHWVTDGEFDRTALAPDNVFDEPHNRLGPSALPLNPNTWNRLQLSLAGDSVRLELNAELIYQRKLEPTNQRTFGLFHYADRTEARVRNVVWRGDWPRKLPPISQQELAGEGADYLDGSLDELAAVFHHDFATDGFSKERFGVNAGNPKDNDAQPDGVRVTRPGGEPGYRGFKQSAIVPRLKVHGNFDIIAAFDKFEANPSAGGNSGVLLQAILDSENSNQYLVYRRHLRRQADPQPIVRAQYVAREVGDVRRTFFPGQVVEAPGGRLRLARRGEKVYFLFAENDSPHFRLFGEETALQDDIGILKLMTETHFEGMTKVVWKSLTIRADKLTGLALQDHNQVVAELDKQRDALADRFEQDFVKDVSFDRYRVLGTLQQVPESGVTMIAVGTDNWTSSELSPLVGFEGDFDVSVDFEDLQLATPKQNMNSTFYLQVEFQDPKHTYASLIRIAKPDGVQMIHVVLRETDEGGNHLHNLIRLDQVSDVETMRLVRRGKRLSLLYRKKDAEHDTILAQQDVPELPVAPADLRFFLRTGGEGRQSDVMLKQFRIHAEKIAPNPVEPLANSEALE